MMINLSFIVLLILGKIIKFKRLIKAAICSGQGYEEKASPVNMLQHPHISTMCSINTFTQSAIDKTNVCLLAINTVNLMERERVCVLSHVYSVNLTYYDYMYVDRLYHFFD